MSRPSIKDRMRRWAKSAGEIFWIPFDALEQGAVIIWRWARGFISFWVCLLCFVILIILAIFLPPARKILEDILRDVFSLADWGD